MALLLGSLCEVGFEVASNPLLDAQRIEEERSRLPERVFRNVRDSATGTFEPPRANKRYYAGLDLAKVESQSFEIHRRPMELVKLLQDVVDGAGGLAERGYELIGGICRTRLTCPRFDRSRDIPVARW